MSETRLSREKPSVPETRPRRIPQNSAEDVRPGFFAFVGIGRKSHTPSARRTSMGGESTCASKERTALETTRPSMHTSPVVFERGKASPLNQQRSFVQSSGQVSAVSTFESATGVDISHDKCAYHNLAAVQCSDSSGGSTHTLGDPPKPNPRFQYQPHTNSHRPSDRDNSGRREDQSPVSPRVKEGLRTGEKQFVAVRCVICTVSGFPKIMRWGRGQQSKCGRPMLFKRLFSVRTSPMNLYELSSFASAKDSEASLGSGGLQRGTM